MTATVIVLPPLPDGPEGSIHIEVMGEFDNKVLDLCFIFLQVPLLWKRVGIPVPDIYQCDYSESHRVPDKFCANIHWSKIYRGIVIYQ